MDTQRAGRPRRKNKLKLPKRDKPLQRVAWLEALFNGLPESVILIDRAGRVVYCNPVTVSFLKQQPESIEPEAWSEKYGLYREDKKTLYPGSELPIVKALKGEHVENEEMILMPQEGESRWITMTAQPLSQTEEGIEGVMVMIRDISVRKQLEDTRQNQNRQAETLYAFSRQLGEIGLDLDLIVDALTSYIANGIGDACTVTMWKDGKLRNVAAAHPIPEAQELLRSIALPREDIDPSFIQSVIDSGKPIILQTAPPEAIQALSNTPYKTYIDGYGLQSILILPLKGRHGVVGVMALSRDRGRPAYTEEELSFAADITYRASLAIENCNLYQSLVREMQQRAHATKAQEESEERLRSIFESTALGIKVLNMEGKIIQINPALQNMLGYSAQELFGRHFTELIHSRDVGRGRINFDAIRQGLRDLRFEHQLIHKDGSIVWVYTTLTGVRANPADGTPAFVVGMVDNVTERKKIEFELREMKGRFLQGVEKERLRLAQDLHDGPMQDLHSVTYLIASMDTLESPYRERLESISQVIQGVITDLRVTARELRPPAIIDFGLENALQSHIEDLRERYPNVRFHLYTEQEALDEEVRLALFRVYQASVANTIRHAEASEVSVRLTLDAEEIRLEIVDNGKGFVVPTRWILLMRNGHFGLAGAAERIEALGGSFNVESEPGKGTRVLVCMAIPSSGDNQTMQDDKSF